MGNNSKGLSLIELLVAIAIVALLIAIGNYAIGTYRQAMLTKLRSDLVSSLERARWLSMTSMPHGVYCGSDRFSLVVAKDGRCSNDAAIQCLKDDDCGEDNLCLPGDYMVTSGESVVILETRSIPRNLSLCCTSSCSSSTVTKIWFDRKGVPRDAIWGLGMTTISISIASESMSVKFVTISSSGRIQYEQ